jgi:hypothetical protein
VIGLNSTDERQVLEDPASLGGWLIVLAFIWAGLRWRNTAHAKSRDADVQFEELETPAVQGLGLSGDGFQPMG